MRTLLIFAVLISVLASSALASYDYVDNPYNFSYCYNLDQGSGNATELCSNGVSNGTLFGNIAWNASAKFNGGVTVGAANSYLTFGNPIPNLNTGDNLTISVWFRQRSGTSTKEFFELGTGTDTSQFHIQTLGATNVLRMGIWQGANGVSYRYWDSTSNITQETNGFHHLFFQMTIGTESTTRLLIDGQNISGSWGGDALSSPYGTNTFMRVGSYAGGGSPESDVDDILVGYNKRFLTEEQIQQLISDATTQPVLSGFNCTSCNIPYGDNETPYTTADTTPTFTFRTDVNSYCAIGKTNQSYTGFGNSRNCTSGEGTKSHTCTLTAQDELTQAIDYVYISCGNTNNVSLAGYSGALQMDITSIGVNAIDLGIQNSKVWPGATVYNDQQVYLRSITNEQVLATVDRVVVYGNQRWLLNFENSSGLGLFNITPAVYSGDYVGLNSSQVQREIAILINNTKN